MMAQAEKIAEKTNNDKAGATVGKALEKLGEKRRALGRGLESLLRPPQQITGGLPTGDSVPGPKAVTHSQPARVSGDFENPNPSKGGLSGAPTPSASPAVESPEAGGEGGGALATGGQPPHHAKTGRAGDPGGAPALPSAGPATIHEMHAAAEIAPATGEGLPVAEIPIEEIDYNPYQTRTHYDENQLNELAASIKVQGVIQAVVVRPAVPPYRTSEDGTPLRYVLILGQRRIMASRRAGKTSIPAVVKRVSEQQAAEMTLIENLQRQDLNCMDQAAAFRQLSEKFRLTQEEIGHRVGVSRETVSNHMRLLRLPERAAGYLNEGRLSFSHARQLLVIEDKLTLERVAERAVREKLSVEKLEELIAEMLGRPLPENAEQKKTGARWVDPNVRAQQRNLESALGMKVRIRDRKGKGTIRIEYSSLDDFDRLVGLLRGKKQ